MDKFRDVPPGLTSPANYAGAVVPSDAQDLPTATRGIYIGGAGDLRVWMVGASAPVTFVGLAAGMIYPLRIARVMATGTTATNLVALA